MNISKDHIEHWRVKLRKQKVPRDEWEQTGKNLDWEIYIQFRGRREWFNLHTANIVIELFTINCPLFAKFVQRGGGDLFGLFTRFV